VQRIVFNWDERTQGIVLGAFFYGFASTQIVSGLVAQKFGGKLLLLLGLFWTAVLTLLTPILTTVGNFPALFVIRLLEGIGGVCVVVKRLVSRHVGLRCTREILWRMYPTESPLALFSGIRWWRNKGQIPLQQFPRDVVNVLAPGPYNSFVDLSSTSLAVANLSLTYPRVTFVALSPCNKFVLQVRFWPIEYD